MGSAFRNRSLEEALGRGRREIAVNALPAGRLAKNCYTVRIPPERGDVALDPLQGELLIHQSVVAVEVTLRIKCGVGKESQVAEPIVDGYDDQVSLRNQRRGVVKK